MGSIGFGSRAWRREKASSRLVKAAARCAPRMALPSARSRLGLGERGLFALRWAVSRLPITIISRLLKSCAMPPLSWPIASIFCEGQVAPVLLQQALSLHPFGDIARYLGKADELTTLVADWIYHDECAKSVSVLSHAETFGFKSAVAHRTLQRPCRQTSLAVFLGVKKTKMLSDDFVRVIPLDTLRARIPRDDDPVRINLEDRVIDDRIDEPPKACICFCEMFEGLLAVCYVPGDLGKANEFSGFIANGINHRQGPEAAAILPYTPAFRLEASDGRRRV